MLDPGSCACVLPCPPGQAQCGSSCCQPGGECAAPNLPGIPAVCCPAGKSCGSQCISKAFRKTEKCCVRGPLAAGGYALGKGLICCGGEAPVQGCDPATERCKCPPGVKCG